MKDKPNLAKRAWTFAVALKDYVKTGMNNVEESVYAKRMSICDGCSERKGNNCGSCGCHLPTKCKWSTSSCPIGKW